MTATPQPSTSSEPVGVAAHAAEVARGARFEFGSNWAHFLAKVDDSRIEEAKASLRQMLQVDTLEGRTFVDAGSGSGLFSLAARMLGAVVHSFDYDPKSVACTAELRRRYFPSDPDWAVEHGSVLDDAYITRLGRFDIVYSWGVLHHTGSMWRAIENAARLTADDGLLFIAIYNAQPLLTPFWIAVKRFYNRSPAVVRRLLAYGFTAVFAVALFVADVFRGIAPSRRYAGTGSRGMTLYYDVVDWIGGWPFEVASPEAIFRFLRDRGFEMREMVTCGGRHGCNQFVFANRQRGGARPGEPV